MKFGEWFSELHFICIFFWEECLLLKQKNWMGMCVPLSVCLSAIVGQIHLYRRIQNDRTVVLTYSLIDV